MNIEFSPNEARVIGCLLEKEITTPDQYPLSLNALTNACNQKTNREPVLELSEAVVQQAVDSLMKKYLVSDKSAGYGGRVTKYKHRFCNTEFGSLKFSAQEVGIICVLLLRGPQTPGELRGRCERMHRFEELSDVQSTLQRLMQREPHLVKVLPRQPGTKEARYAHLLSGEPAEESGNSEVAESSGTGSSLAQMEAEIAALREEVAELRAQVEKVLRLVE
jgi:uncharacterized protein YceH (UPF0502 family)